MTKTSPPAAGAVADVLAQTKRRENGLRDNMDEIATLAHQMVEIVRRGALRPDPKTDWLEPASTSSIVEKSCDEKLAQAERLASDLGYMVVPDPVHADGDIHAPEFVMQMQPSLRALGFRAVPIAAVGTVAEPKAEYAFGHGKLVIEGGLRFGVPAVFIYPAKIGGGVNTSAAIEVRPADAFVEGETVLTFPTEAQADYVIDALYNRPRGSGFSASTPAPASGVEDAADLLSKEDFHTDPADQLAFELAAELEDAELSPNDYVTVNRAKLRAIADRVLGRLAALAPSSVKAWTEASLRDHAKSKGWYIREGTSVPDIYNGGWKHPFSVTVSSSDLIDMLNDAVLASEAKPSGEEA